MSTVADLLKHKGSQVFTIAADATVHDAACEMNARRIGALVVIDGEHVAGIFTERDILSRIVAAERDPRKTLVREVMTADPICVAPTTDLDQVRVVMREKRIRHVPVVDGGRLDGLISIGDLNQIEAKAMAETIQYLEQYTIRM